MRFAIGLLASAMFAVPSAQATVGLYDFTVSGVLTGTQHSLNCSIGGPANCMTTQSISTPFETTIHLPVSDFADGFQLFDYGNPRAQAGEYRGTITALGDGTFSGTGLEFWLTTVPIGCGMSCKGIDQYLTASTFTVRESSASSSAFAALESAPVPEPAAWILMLFGFAALGAGLRWRKPKAAVSYS